MDSSIAIPLAVLGMGSIITFLVLVLIKGINFALKITEKNKIQENFE